MKSVSLFFFFLCLGIILNIISTSLQAVEIAPEGTPERKLQRGFLNIALSGIELSDQLARARRLDQQELALPRWFVGSVRGVFYTAARMLTGVYEMLTFPFPRGGYVPVVKPEFVWEYFPSEESPALAA